MNRLIISLVILVIAIIGTYVFLKPRWKNADGSARSPLPICISTFLILTVVITGAWFFGVTRSLDRMGFDEETLSGMTFREKLAAIDLTFTESKIPTNEDGTLDTKGAILIFYRPGCSDCETIHDELLTAVKGRDKVYFVNTRSEQGSALVNQYAVMSVPNGVYVTNNEDPVAFYKLPLYYEQPDEGTIFYREMLDNLMSYQDQQW